MAQRPSVKKTSTSHPDSRRTQAARWLADAAGRPKQPQPSSQVSQTFIVWGFLLLQLTALLAALLILLPAGPRGQHPDTAVIVTATPTVEVQPVLPQPTPTTTPILPAVPPATAAPATPVPIVVEASPTPAPPTNLKLRGMEITQGIQVFNEPELSPCQPALNHPAHIFCNNSVPLVAGRHTLVRVYPTCSETCPTSDVNFRLRLLKDGQEQANLTRSLSAATLQRLNNLAMLDLRSYLDNSVNFEFFPPPAWMSGQITFVLEAVPQDDATRQLASLTLTQEFAVHKSLRVAYLPINYQGASPPELGGIDYWLLRMYPVSAVEYYRLNVPDMSWEGELNKGEILRQLLHTYWLYTQTQPPETWPDQLFGWLPPEAFNGGASDPAWCPNCAGPHSSRVAFGGLRQEQDIGGPRVLVHEIAHNLGAQHAWSPTQAQDSACFKTEGADIWVDPSWPYLQTPHIQEVGIDLYSNPPVIYPPSAYDVMAYCAQPWISPYTYRTIFNSPLLQPTTTAPLPLTSVQPPTGTGQTGVLLVSAMINPDGSVSKPEIIRLEGSAFTSATGLNPPPGDDYCLDVQAGDNTSLAHHCFDVGFTDVETGLPTTDSSPFFFTLTNIDPQAAAKVTISKNEATLLTVAASNNAPSVTIDLPNGGELLAEQQLITWHADDADGDALYYDLLLSVDGGQSWLPLAVRLAQTSYTVDTSQLPSTRNGLMLIVANDGFNTSVDQSDAPFTIDLNCDAPQNCAASNNDEAPSPAPLLPANSLSLSGPMNVRAGQTFEVSVITNQLDEPNLSALQFNLNFDPALVRVENLRLHSDLTLLAEPDFQNGIGQVAVSASRPDQASPLTGNLTLATFILTAQAEGQADLTLNEVAATTSDGHPLDLSVATNLSVRISHN